MISINPKFFIKHYLSGLRLRYIYGGFLDSQKIDWQWQEQLTVTNSNKFYYITEGECELIIEGRKLHPKKGELYLIPEGCIHSYRLIPGHHLKKHWFHFKADIGQTPLFTYIKTEPFIKVEDPEKIESLFQIINQPEDDLSSALKIKSAMIELVRYFMDQNSRMEFNSCKGELYELTEVIKYMEEHMQQDLTLDQLATVAHLHPNYLVRKFKTYFGYPPVKYMNMIRLNKAKEMLRSTQLPVMEVARAVGFHDISYFSNQFKRQFGLSPNAYKKSN